MRMKLSFALMSVIALSLSAVAAEKKPNIVVILADDLGFGDVKAYNLQGKIATPNLDRLAAGGLTFTNAHTPSAVCSPTRYGLMTGRYCWRSPLKSGVLGGLSPRLIEPDRATLAQMLKDQGYSTACVGKWHLGMDWVVKPGKEITRYNIEPVAQVNNVEYDKPIKNGPNSVGFDYYFGISASLDMVPYTFIENDRVTVNPTSEKAFLMADDHPNGGKTRKGPAAPAFEAADVLPTLTKKAVEVIATHKQEKPLFLYLPLASPHTPIALSPAFRGQSKLNAYADFVMQTDAAVGEVLAALEKAGMANDTLVVFTSDNGCSPQADFPTLLKAGHDPSAGFRGTKADIFEGGHRVPFIVKWPAAIKPGTTDRLTGLTDIYRTCAAVIGTTLPDTAAEDSISFASAWGTGEGNRSNIVHHSINGSFAIRKDNWKLCLCPGSGGWSAPRPGKDDATKLPPVQLFDLATDSAEKVNLQDKHPEIVAELTKLLEVQVAEGRSTPGKPQANTTPVDIRKAGGK